MMRYPPRPAYLPRLWDKRPARLPSAPSIARGRPPRQSDLEGKVYQAILDYAGEHGGNTPTRRELCELADISSTSVVSYQIVRLIARNLLEWRDRKLIVVGAKWFPPDSSK